MSCRTFRLAFTSLILLSVSMGSLVEPLLADEPPNGQPVSDKPLTDKAEFKAPVSATPTAATNDKNKPLELGSDLLLTRARNQELLTQIQNERISFEFHDEPLVDAVARISKLTGIPIILDTVSIEEAGLLVDEPFTLKVKDARVASALSRLFMSLELTWVVENESLSITTIEAASEKLQTRVFAAGDIVNWFRQHAQSDGRRDRFGVEDSSDSSNGLGGGGFSPEESHEILIGLVMEFTGRFWEETHGQGGTISYEGGLLSVHQTLPSLLQVESFVKQLRFIQQSALSTDIWAIPGDGFGWAENRTATAALRKSITVEFEDVPLSEAVAFIAEQLKLQIDIDVASLEEAGLLVDEPIDLTMTATASAVLRQMLRDLELSSILRDDTVLVTTIEVTHELLYTVVADTRELLATGRFTVEGLAATLQQESNGLWEDVDGSGGVLRTNGGLTFIRQTQATIAEVSVLLGDLKARAELAESVEAADDDEKPNRLETRFYKAESREDVEMLMTALTNFVFPDTWETNGGKGVMVEVGSKLVVRQTPEVHRAIAQFNSELQSGGGNASSVGPPETAADLIAR
jgi:hypothetical protein